jgi:DNA-directed RNA polymerase subunit RPC12/RpoP
MKPHLRLFARIVEIAKVWNMSMDEIRRTCSKCGRTFTEIGRMGGRRRIMPVSETRTCSRCKKSFDYILGSFQENVCDACRHERVGLWMRLKAQTELEAEKARENRKRKKQPASAPTPGERILALLREKSQKFTPKS